MKTKTLTIFILSILIISQSFSVTAHIPEAESGGKTELSFIIKSPFDQSANFTYAIYSNAGRVSLANESKEESEKLLNNAFVLEGKENTSLEFNYYAPDTGKSNYGGSKVFDVIYFTECQNFSQLEAYHVQKCKKHSYLLGIKGEDKNLNKTVNLTVNTNTLSDKIYIIKKEIFDSIAPEYKGWDAIHMSDAQPLLIRYEFKNNLKEEKDFILQIYPSGDSFNISGLNGNTVFLSVIPGAIIGDHTKYLVTGIYEKFNLKAGESKNIEFVIFPKSVEKEKKFIGSRYMFSICYNEENSTYGFSEGVTCTEEELHLFIISQEAIKQEETKQLAKEFCNSMFILPFVLVLGLFSQYSKTKTPAKTHEQVRT